MYRRMKVAGLTIDPLSNSPIMLLQDEETEESLPIWIGLLEATAIASELEKVEFSRPMTHDLFKNVTEKLGASLKKIEVCDLKENTFYALVHFAKGDREMVIDARPSDAVALALRFNAPIFVAESVLEKSKETSGKQPGQAEIQSEEGDKWAEVLKDLDPEDFGKYKM